MRGGLCSVGTYQSRWTSGVSGMIPGAGEHRLDLVPGEVARVDVRPDHCCEQPLLVLKLGGDGLLEGSGVGALLHRSQNPRLLPLRYATESHSCNNR